MSTAAPAWRRRADRLGAGDRGEYRMEGFYWVGDNEGEYGIDIIE